MSAMQHVLWHKLMSNHTIKLLLLAAAKPPVLSGEISLQQASALYGAEDAKYLSRYTSMEGLSLRLQARRLLLYGLQELGHTQRPVHILKTKHGRPYLTHPDIAVSFSYTDRALCLLGTREKTKDEQDEELCIGADWEEMRTSHLPPASFLAADQAWTECVDEKEDNATRILKKWCRTEAVLKAAGCGIRIHPRSIEWTEHDKGRHAGTAIVHASKRKELYTWQDVQPDNQHLCAVAVKGEYQALSLQLRRVTDPE